MNRTQGYLMLKQATAAAIAMTASAASAVTFDFDAAGGDQATLDFLVDGLGLQVSATSFDETSRLRPGDDSVVTQSTDGLGVRNTVADPVNAPENNTFIDGRSSEDTNDVLLFDFGKTVTVDEIVFTLRPGAQFEASEVSLFLGGPFSSIVQPAASFSFPGPARSFGLGALGDLDQFKIASISVSVIPLPAAAPLLLAGLGGLALMRRRRG